MKMRTLLMLAAFCMVTSCGTMSRLASTGNGQKFQDGIYGKSPDLISKAEKAEGKAKTEELIAKTKESPIYLFGDRKDTVMIPEDHMATVRYDQKLGSTVVTVTENPYDWRNNINPWSSYPHHQVTKASCEGCPALDIGLLRCNGIKFCIVVYAEVHGSVSYGSAISIYNLHLQVLGGSIGRQAVYLGIALVTPQHLFLAVVVGTENTCVYQHGTGCSPVEPALIQNSLGFAGAHKAPTAVALIIIGNPDLHPSVVTVGVRPSGTIYLTCRNTYGTHGSYGKCTFLTTASDSICHSSKWR